MMKKHKEYCEDCKKNFEYTDDDIESYEDYRSDGEAYQYRYVLCPVCFDCISL